MTSADTVVQRLAISFIGFIMALICGFFYFFGIPTMVLAFGCMCYVIGGTLWLEAWRRWVFDIGGVSK